MDQTLTGRNSRVQDTEDEFSATSKMKCQPTAQDSMAIMVGGGKGPKNVLEYLGKAEDLARAGNNTISALLVGRAVGGTLQLHATQNIGVAEAAHKCAVASMTVTPAPANPNELAVAWKETGEESVCQGADMLLTRKPH